MTLVEFCLKIGLNIEKSDMLSDRVCFACGRKMKSAFQLYDFISSNLERNKS